MSSAFDRFGEPMLVTPEGSRELWTRDLGWASVKTIDAVPGSFSGKFTGYTIVVGEGPADGPLTFNGRPVLAPSGRSLSFSAFRPDDEVTGTLTSGVVYHFLSFNPTFVSQALRDETQVENISLPPFLRSAPQPLFWSLWRWLLSSVKVATETADEVAQVCARLLLVLLIEPQVSALQNGWRSRHANTVDRVTAHIAANLSERLELRELASLAGMSTYHFARVFKAHTGLSVHQFVLECRLEGARARLAGSPLAISAIAAETGFSSQSHLTTAFKRRFGLTPKAYRTGLLPEGSAPPDAA